MSEKPVFVIACMLAFMVAAADPAATAGGLATHSPPAREAAVSVGAAPMSQALQGRYVVTLREDVEPQRFVLHAGIKAGHLYTSAMRGFSAELDRGSLEALRRSPAVTQIEEDARLGLSTTQTPVTWGLDRSDQRTLPLSGSYTYVGAGRNVNAYVLDTGVETSHPDFEGRARVVYDALGGSGQDCNGHGTHVAGTIGGKTHGMAKEVGLRAVRVLDCTGSGSTSSVIAGLDWVKANAVKPAVANLSISGPHSRALNRAAAGLGASGVVLAVAAGNGGADACKTSPGSAMNVITVAAVDRTDTRAPYSNYGKCVDLYAPGSSVLSDWVRGGTNTISGTSMAAPHVAGVAVLYKGRFGEASSETVEDWLKANATLDLVQGNPVGTANRMLHTGGF